jgi:hypothetical protein
MRSRFRGPVSAVVVLTAVAAVWVSAALAAATPAEKCAAAKNKAAVKKLSSKLKCYRKAILAGQNVDAICLTDAETKFDAAMTKIEARAKGGCPLSGDGPTIEQAVDAGVRAIADLTPQAPLTCCSFGGGTCSYATSPSNCTSGLGTPGATGSVCDGATGNCISPPAAAGSCCSNPNIFTLNARCAATAPATCTSAFLGTVVPNAICSPTGDVCVPF